ncbi:WhiB family transcriptional regulator [Mycolicibacterium sp. HK-90]|uniref:WhiB family transcriptional regulator n=1 Tax=Mycolicibacterium sp. HK-90 TaxID=3056937 RepID=UPI0026584034|nr:WhiB family transcriptional regulator [Mycolicibacterium sp. HK-90]WKG04093.1 WhiB family transcriptional regulator [Mycolicibacterium sp. HK-90]
MSASQAARPASSHPPEAGRARGGPDRWPLDWGSRASCRDIDPIVFFGPERERASARQQRVSRAKAICRGCPVQHPCREQSLRFAEPHGVWGGLTSDERTALREPGSLRGDESGVVRVDDCGRTVTQVEFDEDVADVALDREP